MKPCRLRLRLLFVFAFGLPACAAEEAPSFARDILPLFEANCSGCHASNVKMGSLDLDTFASTMKGGNNGAIIVPGDSARSRLYLMVSHQVMPYMPLSQKQLAAGEIETIRKWIDAGAKPPAPAEAGAAAATRKPAIPDIRPKAPVHAEIATLAYSPDGKMLALGSFREVRLVDAGGRVIATLSGHAEQVRSVAFSKDGKLLAAAGGFPGVKGEVKIWDLEKRTELVTIKGHSDCIYAVAFAPDGKTIATSSYDKLIKLWDVAGGKEVRTLKDHIDAIYALAFTPNGKLLVSAAADRAVKVWNPASGERLYTFSEPSDGLNTLALDPTGKYVAAGGLDKTIRIWELGETAGKLKSSLIAHEDAILKLAWSPDGQILISAAADRTMKAFSVPALTEIKDFPKQSDWVLALDFAPDGKRFAVGRFDGTLSFVEAPAPPAHVAQK